MFFLSQHHTGSPIIDILNNCSDLGVFLAQRPDKIILRRKNRGGRDQHNHDLTAGKAAANQYMTQKAVAGILVIGADLKGFEHTTDRANDLICLLILDHAGFHRNDMMGFFFIDTGNGFALAVSEYGMYFIAIMKRILHSFDRMYLAVVSEKLLHLTLLHLELFFIRHIQILASTAAVCHRAETVFFLLFLRLFLLIFLLFLFLLFRLLLLILLFFRWINRS